MTVTLATADEMAAIDREWVRRRGLREFVRRAWHQVDTSALQWNWHHDAICEHLEAVTRREIRTLVINVPPGTSKSTIVSVLWPAWVWTSDPEHRWIAATYDQELAFRDARRHRRIVGSDWFRARWPAVQLPASRDESTAVGLFFNTAGGMRNSITVRGGATGKHGDTHVVDDPIDVHGASQASGKELDEAIEWWDGTMSTRFREPTNAARVLVQQRLHARDPAGHVAAQPGTVVLCLPMRFNPAHPHVYARDPRTAPGELLHPERFPEAVVQKLEVALGPTGAAAQLGQLPVPPGGYIFKKEYLRHRWTELPPGGTYTLSVDCKFTDAATRSWVVIQCWYQLGPNHYLVDQARGHWGFVETCRELVAMAARYPKALRKLVEKKANGAAVVNVLKATLPGFEEIEPDGGKEARANACEPLFAAGNVFVPDPTHARYADGRRGAEWLEREPDGYVRELITFPKGLADDQVDATTQYLNRCGMNPLGRLKQAMDNMLPTAQPTTPRRP